MPEETARLFVGIEPDEAARHALSDWAQALSVRVSGRYYAPDLYHVTLCFLGQTARERISAIVRAMREAYAEPFEARLSETGTFKGGAVLYAGVEKSACLAALQERLCASLRREGFSLNEEAEHYVPHITLARHAAGLTEPEKAPECTFSGECAKGAISAESATISASAIKYTFVMSTPIPPTSSILPKTECHIASQRERKVLYETRNKQLFGDRQAQQSPAAPDRRRDRGTGA